MAEPTGRVLVVIPTYEERDNLGPVLSRLHAAVPEADVLVVDDASPDGTGELADEMAAADPRIQVLHRPGKAGLGAAYLAGFATALAGGYQVVVEMDADGSHPPEDLPALLAALDDADVVLGSRYVPGGTVRNWPAHRQLLSRGANLYSRIALGVPIKDITAGYRVFRRQVLEELDLGQISSQGYCFQIDMAWRAVQAGFRVREVPITFTERERGASKMSGAIVVEAFWRVACWGAGRVLHRPDRSSAAGAVSSAAGRGTGADGPGAERNGADRGDGRAAGGADHAAAALGTTSTDGMVPNGAVPNGAVPNGAVPNGAVTEGLISDGRIADDAVSDGPVRA